MVDPKKKKATPKEKALVKHYVASLNGVQSALKVYNTKSPRNAGVIAHNVLKRPHVRELVEEAFNKEEITPSSIIKTIKGIAGHEIETKVNADQVLRASKELATIMDLYPAKKSIKASYSYSEHYDNMDFNDLKEEVNRLREINGKLDAV